MKTEERDAAIAFLEGIIAQIKSAGENDKIEHASSVCGNVEMPSLIGQRYIKQSYLIEIFNLQENYDVYQHR